jgi:hypothetical protein
VTPIQVDHGDPSKRRWCFSERISITLVCDAMWLAYDTILGVTVREESSRHALDSLTEPAAK